MEYVARQINDEDVFEGWLALGVADGDIAYGDMTADCEDYYKYDQRFEDLMDTFLWVMHRAFVSGGLYCDGVVSK
jgi:hypothetical protein